MLPLFLSEWDSHTVFGMPKSILHHPSFVPQYWKCILTRRAMFSGWAKSIQNWHLQETDALESSVKPTRGNLSGPQNSCTHWDNLQKSGTLSSKLGPSTRKTQGTVRGSHLNILHVTTATQLTNKISAAMQCNYHCYKDTRLFLKTEALFNECFWAQGSIIASLYCLYLWQYSLACKLFCQQFNVVGLSTGPRRVLRDLMQRNLRNCRLESICFLLFLTLHMRDYDPL